ncbi:hypothetical protein ACFXPM_30410 [Streptomyces sp. NPDC059095]|uniref:hypothetical protein n=1 Tax=Streptomyces sp. NPDC059095 TaxID=3346726 RepID=UPI003688F7B7
MLTYDESEHGFSFSAQSSSALTERLGTEGVTSLLIGTLQLEVDIESQDVLFAWGYLPNIRRKTAALGTPDYSPGQVSISTDYSLEPGVSLDVPGENWEVLFDPASGWVAILRKKTVRAELVQVASGIVLGLTNGDLVSIWLLPVPQGSRDEQN